MDEQELSQFKKQLESMKVDINSDVEKTLTEMTSQTGNIPDPNDRATIESDRSFELRIRGRERKLMAKIDEALASASTTALTAYAPGAAKRLASSDWRRGR